MALDTNCEDPRGISQEFERERDEQEEIAKGRETEHKEEIDSDFSILQSCPVPYMVVVYKLTHATPYAQYS